MGDCRVLWCPKKDPYVTGALVHIFLLLQTLKGFISVSADLTYSLSSVNERNHQLWNLDKRNWKIPYVVGILRILEALGYSDFCREYSYSNIIT